MIFSELIIVKVREKTELGELNSNGSFVWYRPRWLAVQLTSFHLVYGRDHAADLPEAYHSILHISTSTDANSHLPHLTFSL